MPGPLIIRWTMEQGGSVGEVSLFELSSVDSYVVRSKTRKYVELSDLHIDAAARGQGWSRHLLKQALSYADEQNWIVFLRPVQYSDGPLTSAQLAAYYARFGFRNTRHAGEMLRG